jgi:hypothetical protein
MLHDTALYGVIAALAATTAVTLAFNVRAATKLMKLQDSFDKFRERSLGQTLSLIAGAEQEMDKRVINARVETLKKAHQVEKSTGFTLGEIFGKYVGGEGDGKSEREIIQAGISRAIDKAARPGIEGAGLGELIAKALRAKTDPGGSGGGFARTWTEEGVGYSKTDDGPLVGEFEWEPGEAIPTHLPEEVQTLLRGLQAMHDKATAGDPGETVRHHLDAPDAEDLAKAGGSADPLTDRLVRSRKS